MGRCTACTASRTSQQVVFGEGSDRARIVSIGEAPGPDEDIRGRPFIGRAGGVYDRLLDEARIPRPQVYTTNTILCYPGRRKEGGFNKPDDQQVEICTTHWLFPVLAALKPRVILAWGLTATQMLLKTTAPMGELVGKEVEQNGSIVIPLYHPSYFLHNASDYTAWRLVVDALVRAKQLAGLAVTGTYVDQVKIERHQEDKRVIAALESRSAIFEHRPWRDEREYINAWTDGTDIVLLFKDGNQKRRERIEGFKWYFYLQTDDVFKLPPNFWRKWFDDGLVVGLKADPANPDWTMVFARRQVRRTTALREHLLEGSINLWDERQIQKFESDRHLRELLDELEQHGVQHYEADLTPSKRFMADYDLKIAADYNELFLDIETDDTLPLVDRLTLGDRRILSIAWELHPIDKAKKPEVGFLLLRREDDRAEADLMAEFAEVIPRSDILYAWNGNNFDFPILRARARKFKVGVPWEEVHTIDLLRTWFRYFQRGATVNTSFALQNIAKHVLKQEKVDWKAKAATRGLRLSKFIQLYREAPDILEEYNRDDTHKLVELEKFTGFAKIDQVFCRIGNCFVRDYHITTKIDSLLLKRAKQAGVHFKSRKVSVLQESRWDRMKHRKEYAGRSGAQIRGTSLYEGAYVLEPKKGYWEGVAALDFKSLYPSVMVAWNISPETYVPDDEAASYPADRIIECPTGAKFRTDVQGFIPTIFADTGEKRRVYQQLQAEQPVGSDLFLLYYRLAYSFKRLGLSFYGDMGNVESRYFNPRVAAAVTLSGQYLLKKAVAYGEELGYPALYGDTDSLYIKIPQSEGGKFVEAINTYLQQLLVREWNVPATRFTVELEYENYFPRIFFVRKKRYAGLMTMYKGKEASFTEIKGFECMRSDGIEFARRMQRTVIEMILRHRSSVKEITNFLFEQREQVFTKRLSLDDITITKGIAKSLDDYKANAVHVTLARQYRQEGGEFFVGMKIPYVVTKGKPKLEAVLAEHFTGTYDADYYWDHLILPPTYRIVEVLYPSVSWDLLFTAPTSASLRRKLARETARTQREESTQDDDHERAS